MSTSFNNSISSVEIELFQQLVDSQTDLEANGSLRNFFPIPSLQADTSGNLKHRPLPNSGQNRFKQKNVNSGFSKIILAVATSPVDSQPLDWTYKQALQSGNSGRTSTPAPPKSPEASPVATDANPGVVENTSNAGVSEPQVECNTQIPCATGNDEVGSKTFCLKQINISYSIMKVPGVNMQKFLGGTNTLSYYISEVRQGFEDPIVN